MKTSNLWKTTNILLTVIVSLVLCGTSFAAAKPDPFYLPQPKQPFEGKVDTRIGKLKFENQYPSRESMETILDSMDFHGATQAYLWGIPIASFANLQYFLQEKFKFDQCDLMETKTLEDKLGILTANATTPYIFCTPNLAKTGPMVVEVPAGSIAGMVDDFWQRPITDIGLPGPDKGKGAKYLFTPPGYKGKKPDSYRVFESPTNNIFLASRIIEPDPAKYSKLKSGFRSYPYKDRANVIQESSREVLLRPATRYGLLGAAT